ncbi:HNH endonuclease [Salinisphaera orenii]|uniref:HNH endonuclease n=1 Tax=Salinisphaera orenii TaxID=856731 RepID=UPI000DBE5466
MTDLAAYCRKFRSLNVNRAGDRISPHKMCMLLAVIDLFDAQPDRANRIEYSPQLLERFRDYFQTVAGPGDRANPYFPFFHLKSEGFWHVQPRQGRREALRALTTVRSPAQVTDNIDCVALDSDLYGLLREQHARAALTETIVTYWFERRASELQSMVERSRRINRYERQLRGLDDEVPSGDAPPEAIRDPAFRRVVLEAYDYRCAATGTRIILPDESVMVQAAHIEPFAETRNDDPCNGLALTPDMHWAMDKGIIAPGPDYKWHVSGELDPRIPDNEPLMRLDDKGLLLPTEQRFWPKEMYLKWRHHQLA